QRQFEQVLDAVDDPHLLALGHRRTDPRPGVEAADARAAGPDALRQRALRHDLELDLARPVLLLEQAPAAAGGADGERRDHLAQLPLLTQHVELIAETNVVGDTRNAAYAFPLQREDERRRRAGRDEAAEHDRHPVRD